MLDGDVGRKHHGHDEKPNKVLFVRNCPRCIIEDDLVALTQPFSPGFKPRIYVQAAKGQGFVELVDTHAATRCLQYFSMNPVQLRRGGGGSTLHFSYSTRESVTTHDELVASLASTSRVLLVHVVNMLYPVSIESLHSVFSRHGLVEKIVTFQKDQSVFQAMVQFDEPTSAASALQKLDSKDIFTGCNTLKIQYSTFDELTVKYNNGKTRDFTNPNLPAGPGAEDPGFSPGNLQGMSGMAGMGQNGGANDFYALQQMMYGLGVDGAQSWSHSAAWSGQTPGVDQRPSQTVIICYHLTPDRLSVEQLFNLFSLYGLVLRIKILQNKPDCCLVQYTEPLFASLAIQNLQGAQLYGQSLHLDFSKMREITMLPQGKGSLSERTKEFSASDQRYTQQTVHAKVMRSCKPQNVLHVCNIAQDATELDLRTIIGPNGTITAFRWLEATPEDGGSALVQLDHPADALVALVHAHNAPLRDRLLKVSFSKMATEAGEMQ